MNFLSAMEAGVLCGDPGWPDPALSPETWSLSDPERISLIHSAALAAGAQVIRTNTRRANGASLRELGFGHQVNEINWISAQLAVTAARGSGAFVAGSVGPVALPFAEQEGAFLEQIGALLDGRAQLIHFEGFTRLDELLLALRAKDTLHHCPAICAMRASPEGLLGDGKTLVEAVSRLAGEGAQIVGFEGDLGSTHVAGGIRQACGLGLFVSFAFGRSDSWPVSQVRGLIDAGVHLLGGGADPAFTAELLRSIKGTVDNIP